MAGIQNFTTVPNVALVGPGGQPLQVAQPVPVQILSAATGAITLNSGLVSITYNGGAGAYTIAPPDQDGQTLTIVTETAQAHVLTQGTVGFNAKGSSGTCTWTATIGNAVVLVSRNGNWWAPVKTGVTLA